MNKNIQEKIIDITGIELTPGTLPFALVTASKVLSVVATSVITFCFVFPSLMFKSKKKILLQVKIILQNSQKMTENVKCSLSFSCQFEMEGTPFGVLFVLLYYVL
ncbi:MAG: hypothetical protein IJX02_06305 [Clostridia bacterium]|nr:hypothetical protein [Clostridia bacterium]